MIASQAALSNVTVLADPVSFTSPLTLSARNDIVLAANLSVTGASSTVSVYADSDCTGLGQLKIANNSYLLSVQQTQSIAIVAAQLNLDAGWIFAGVGRAPLTFTTCTNHAMDVGGSGASTHAVDPLQLTQLALSHMSAASLNLSSTGGAGHIYVYDTVAADFALMSTALVSMSSVNVSLTHSHSEWPSLFVDGSSGMLFGTDSSLSSFDAELEFRSQSTSHV